MRVFLYTLIGIPLLIVDAVLIYTLPSHLARRFTLFEGMVLLGGMLAYLVVHFLVRRPERLYLWGHELTHLVVAKIFFREVHGFHITSRSGGKVVIDRTNVAIDLAPYAAPFYCLATFAVAAFFQPQHRYAREVYLAVGAFFYAMHLSFSIEGFVDGQPDLRRSGRLFSASVVLLFLLLWLPFLSAPGTKAGFPDLPSLYEEWLRGGWTAARRLLAAGVGRSFF